MKAKGWQETAQKQQIIEPSPAEQAKETTTNEKQNDNESKRPKTTNTKEQTTKTHNKKTKHEKQKRGNPVPHSK